MLLVFHIRVIRVIRGSLGIWFALCAAVIGIASASAATNNNNQSPVIQVGRSYHSDVSPPLREIAQRWFSARRTEERSSALNPRTRPNYVDPPDAVIQNSFVAPDIPSPILNFQGMRLGFGGTRLPPDPTGAVGPTQYVQTVNRAFQIFDKTTGASVLGPAMVPSLWTGFGGICETSDASNSNPSGSIVLYDQLANRWIITQIVSINAGGTAECIAVSTTSDATGNYYRHGFQLGTNLSVLPKLSVWPDAYYMTVEVFNSSGSAFLGPQPYAFDRAKMLNGETPTYITPGILGTAVPPLLSADLDGSTLPPTDAPATFMSFPRTGQYTIYHFHVDFTTPANSTWTTFATLTAAAFVPLCSGMSSCVPQPDTTVGLNGLGIRLMYRLTYRNFSGHESVVGNYAVNSNGVAGIRWFELRNVTNGPVTVYQEGTYQPDSTWRWTGSTAMDGAGNLALGFSASSSTVYPSIRYTGRLASDPLNTLPQGEATLIAGAGSQNSSAWGGDSSMSVDPVDDCTFWYTNEYYETTISGAWRTRIGNFKFKECTGGPTPSPTPTATATATATFPPTPTPGTPTPTPSATVPPTATPTPSDCPGGCTPPSQALNISTRLRVQTGDNVLIGGFIIRGNAPKNVAVRGIGPSLGPFGVPDPLADPTLELRDSNGMLLIANDNWQDDPAQATQLTALGLAPQDTLESGLVTTLTPNASYTAILAGKNGGTGVGLVEAYDTNSSVNSDLANISTRGFVLTGNDVMIGGFILGGNPNQTLIVVRGIGPSLAGILNPVLADPTLELRDSNGMLLVANDNWQDDPASAAQLTAHGLAPQNPLESGIFASLPAGAFTSILAGRNGGTGIGLVEIYNVQ